MPNIIDHLSWRGDVPLSCAPFNDVDNLILAQFCYLPLEGAEVPCDGMSVRDIAALLEGHPDAFGFIDAQGNHEMLKLMASGDRFGKIQVQGYCSETDEEKGFVELPGLKRTSLKIDEVLDRWLFDMQEDERMELVEALYAALKQAELKTVEGLLAHRLKTAVSILSAVRHFDPETRHLVWEKLIRLAGVALKGNKAEQE